MAGDQRVTTVVVGLLIAFCALLLAKWLALVALAALLLGVVLRVAFRGVVRRVRARRMPVAAQPAVAVTETALDRAAARRATVASAAPVVPAPRAACSWCGLVGGHRDRDGRPVRPRHAHALPPPARHAS